MSWLFFLNQTVVCIPTSNWVVGKYFQRSTTGRLLQKGVSKVTAVCKIPEGPIAKGYEKLHPSFPTVLNIDLLSMTYFRSIINE